MVSLVIVCLRCAAGGLLAACSSHCACCPPTKLVGSDPVHPELPSYATFGGGGKHRAGAGLVSGGVIKKM